MTHTHALPPALLTGSLKFLKMAAMGVKEKWPDYVKVTQPKKDTPGFPWPVSVTRAIQRPDKAKAWEVWELTIKLVVEGKGSPGSAPPVRAEVSCDCELPPRLQERMQEMVAEHWRSDLEGRESNRQWFLEETLTWAEESYTDILSCMPVFVNRFIGVTDAGTNEWR